jgi:hypothetical protein
MINVQGPADFTPLIPFVAIFAAVAIVTGLDTLAQIISRFSGQISFRTGRTLLFAGVCSWITIADISDAFAYNVGRPTLSDQQAEVDRIVSHLGNRDTIFVHGTTEILVLAGLPNTGPHYFLDRGKDDYLDQVEPGGFAAWFARLKAQRPRIVALSRLNNVSHRQDFVDWANSDYERRQGRFITYYLRRD